jgi:hypothetical protein
MSHSTQPKIVVWSPYAFQYPPCHIRVGEAYVTIVLFTTELTFSGGVQDADDDGERLAAHDHLTIDCLIGAFRGPREPDTCESHGGPGSAFAPNFGVVEADSL